MPDLNSFPVYGGSAAFLVFAFILGVMAFRGTDVSR